MSSKTGFYITSRMPTPEEAAAHSLVILNRGTTRQKWRDSEGRIWSGEVRSCSPLQFQCWLALKPDFDYQSLNFWKKSVWFDEQTTSFNIPGLISREEALKVEPFTAEVLSNLSDMHWAAVIDALRRHNEFIGFRRSLSK